MKSINKILCLLLTVVMLITVVTPVMAASEATVKMYAADGRTTDVPQSKVDAYRKVGWYNGPIITIYAADGRTKKIGANDKAAYLKVGWFATKPVKMYTEDGRTKYVETHQVEAYKKVGWYDSPVITVYAADGRTKKIPSSKKDAYLKVGWYDSPIITMYAADGRTKKIPSSQKEAYTKVGWYYGPITTVYSTDGKTKKIGANDKAEYLKKGYFNTKPVKMYSPDGRTKFVESYDVETNKKVGWYTEAVRMMYNSKGESKIVKQKDIEANKKNGWMLEAPKPKKGTLQNPYSASEGATITYQRWSHYPAKQVSIKCTNVIRGAAANTLANSENRYNEKPNSNQEWCFFEFDVKYISCSEGSEVLEGSDIIYTDTFFTSTGSSLNVADLATLGDTYDGYGVFDTEFYPGASGKVVIGILINKNAGDILLRVPNKTANSETWIKCTGGSSNSSIANTTSNSSTSGYYCYSGTSIPTYTSVTGVYMKQQDTLNNGAPVYRYAYTDAEDVGDYWRKLSALGWTLSKKDDESTSETFESSYRKGSKFIIINVYWDLEEVWITHN